MLSNFEMSGKSLFQTFLIGQKQLGDTMSLPEMEQFRQRIVATYQLKPLDEEETKQYILFRMQKAGWKNSPQFNDDIFNRICSYTQGIPRRINTLCDRVLLFGYLDELKVITLNAVQKVITDIEEESSLVTDEFHDVTPAPLILSASLETNHAYEERIAALEKTVVMLQSSLNKERTLLRKAILLQLDMSDVYNEDSVQG